MKRRTLLITLLSLATLPAFSAKCSPFNDNSANTTIELSQLKYGRDFISVGNISASVNQKIKLSPDTAQFSITYISEGKTPNDASNRNAENMKKLNAYLHELGLSKNDLTTVAYQNYEQSSQQKIANSSSELNQSSITASADIGQDQVFSAIQLLETNNILNLEINQHTRLYNFKVTEVDNRSEVAMKRVKERYQKIEKLLNDMGVNKLTILNYENSKISAETEMVKRYYVTNTIKVKVVNFDNLGKIITKAQELKMNVNNDMEYSVSDEARNKAIRDNEETILKILMVKAQRLLSSSPNSDYQLGHPITLTSGAPTSISSYRPRSVMPSVTNSGQVQSFAASDIQIQPPSEYEITVSLSGTFDIIKPQVSSTNFSTN